MKVLCVVATMLAAAAHASVIECKFPNGQSLLTSDQSCPPGTTFKRPMAQDKKPSIANDDLLAPINTPRSSGKPNAQQPTQRPNLQAGVLECYVSDTQIMYTTAQFCPPGTRFKGINYNTRDPGIAAAQGQQRNSQVIEVKRSCETLKQLRNYYDRMLDPGMNREPNAMQKLRDVQKEMTENGCRI